MMERGQTLSRGRIRRDRRELQYVCFLCSFQSTALTCIGVEANLSFLCCTPLSSGLSDVLGSVGKLSPRNCRIVRFCW